MMNTTELIIGLIIPTAAAIALAWLLVRRLDIDDHEPTRKLDH